MPMGGGPGGGFGGPMGGGPGGGFGGPMGRGPGGFGGPGMPPPPRRRGGCCGCFLPMFILAVGLVVVVAMMIL